MHAQSRTAIGDTRGSSLGSPVAREDDAAKAAEYRALETKLLADADHCRARADEADALRTGGGVKADYAAERARYYRLIAEAAEHHAGRAAERAADYEYHASLQVSA
jgi:hypothetical protein